MILDQDDVLHSLFARAICLSPMVVCAAAGRAATSAATTAPDVYPLAMGVIAVLLVLIVYLVLVLRQSARRNAEAESRLQKGNSDLRRDVTRQTRRLLINEQQFRDKLDNMREGIQIIGFDWQYIYVNDALVAQSHYTREQLIGHTPVELYPDVEGTQLYAALKQVMTTRQPRRTETAFTFPDGTETFFDLSIQPVPEGIFILSIDITRQRRNADRLLKMNRLYAFISNINQSIVHLRDEQQILDRLCDIALDIGTFNSVWIGTVREQGTLDISVMVAGPAGKVQSTRFDGIHIDDPHFSIAPVGIAWRTGRYALSNDAQNDPDLLPWREQLIRAGIRAISAFPIIKDGKAIGVFGLDCSSQDFFDTDEIALLEEVAGDISFAIEVIDRERQLRVSEHRLRRAQAIAHLGHWELNLITREATWSEEACMMYGLPPTTRAQQFDTWVAFIHPEDRDSLLAMIRSAAETHTDLSYDHRIIRTDGAIRHLHSEAKFELDPQGRAVAIYGITQDITERRLAEEEIRQLNERLEQRVAERTAELTEVNQALEAFSYSASHDLRAPLRTISGYIGVIQEDYGRDFNEDLTQLFAQINNGAKRMNTIIDDMLTLARYSQGQLELTQVDMDKLVQTVWNNISATTPHQAHLTMEQLPVVTGDFSMLQQVLVNLLSNAIKYSSKKENPQITVGATTTAGDITFYIHDNGAGFDMASYSKLFGAFQRLHGSTEFEGTGVGLLLVKRIIEKHGGLVWAEGRVGEGATFYFSLPVACTEATPR